MATGIRNGERASFSTGGVPPSVACWNAVAVDGTDGGEAGIATERDDERPGRSESQRILVVEDDRHIGRLVERILVREGFEVVRVSDVASALDVLETGEVDLLFTDVVLPGAKSGADLAASLRRDKPHLPIILTTGYDQSRIAAYPGLLEAVAFLPKPFTAAQVREMVRTALSA